MRILLFTLIITLNFNIKSQSPIIYDWDNSKEGWVSGGGCTLIELPGSMAMKSFNVTPKMRGGTLQDDLGIDASDYNTVEVILKNPTTTQGNPNARLFVYPPGSNTEICYYNFLVDTSMNSFASYTIHLDSTPTSGTYSGPVARFGLRGPWGVANGDTIFWKKMTISNSNYVLDSIDVTIKLDMSHVSDPFTSPEINGTFNSWCGNCDIMSDNNGDNIWEKVVSFMPNDTIEYKFSADNWSIQESLNPNDSCTNGNNNFTNRVLVIPDSNITLPTVCWNSCNPCPPISIPKNDISLEIYPNPSNDFLHINSSEKIEKIVLRDLLGKVYMIESPMSNNLYLEVNKLSNNIYFLESFINKKWETNKIMVLH